MALLVLAGKWLREISTCVCHVFVAGLVNTPWAWKKIWKQTEKDNEMLLTNAEWLPPFSSFLKGKRLKRSSWLFLASFCILLGCRKTINLPACFSANNSPHFVKILYWTCEELATLWKAYCYLSRSKYDSVIPILTLTKGTRLVCKNTFPRSLILCTEYQI